MSNKTKKLKGAFIVICILGGICAFLLGIPQVQHCLCNLVLQEVSEKTGYNIITDSVFLSPRGKLEVRGLHVSYKGRQVIVCQDARFSVSFSFRFPFLHAGRLELIRPVIVAEVDKAGKVVWPVQSGGQESAESGTFYLHPAFFPEIRLVDGSISVLQDGYLSYSVRNVDVIVYPKKRSGSSIALDVRMTGNIENPQLGFARISGIAELRRGIYDIPLLTVESPDALLANISARWYASERRGSASLRIHYLEPSHNVYLSRLMTNTGVLKGVVNAQIEGNTISGEFHASSSQWGMIETRFRVIPNADMKSTVIEAYGPVAFNGHVETFGALRLRAYWRSEEDFYGIVDLQDVSIHRAESLTNWMSFVEGGSARIEISPRHISISPAIFKTHYGHVLVQSRVGFKGGEDRSIRSGIQFYCAWRSKINVSATGVLATRGKIVGECDRQCNAGLEKWTIQTHANIKRDDARIELNGGLSNGTVDFQSIIQSVPFEKVPGLKEFVGKSIEGTASGSVKISGHLNDPRIALEVTVDSPSYGDYKAKKVHLKGQGQIRGDGKRSVEVFVSDLVVPDIATGVKTEANVTQSGDRLDFNIKGDDIYRRQFSVSGKVSDLWNKPEIAIEKGRLDWLGVYEISGGLKVSDGTSVVLPFVISHDDGRITFSGRIDHDHGMVFQCELDRFSFSRIASHFGGVDVNGGEISGQIEGRIGVNGVKWNLDLAISHGSVQVRKANYPSEYMWDSVQFKANGDETSVFANVTVDSPYLKERAEFSAHLPIKVLSLYQGATKGDIWVLPLRPLGIAIVPDLASSLKGSLIISGLDLNIVELFYPGDIDLGGRLSVKLEVNGSWNNPSLQGKGQIEGGEVVLPQRKDLIVQNIEGTFSVDDNSIHIQRFGGRCLDGELTATGDIPIKPGFEGFNISLNAKKVGIPEMYGISGIITGQCNVTLKNGNPDISGLFSTHKVLLDLNVLQDKLVKQVDTIEVVEEEEGVELIAEEKSEGFYDLISMDIAIDLSKGNAWVKGLGVDAEVKGKIFLKKQSGRSLKVFGGVTSQQGWYSFQNLKLKITEGEVRFKGLVPPNPNINFTGEKVVKDATIMVSVTGNVSSPVLNLSSIPSMSDVDILSYLLFNQPASNLTTRESLNLQERAVMFLGSQAAKKLKEIMGDSMFSPDVLDVHTGEEGQGIIEVGKYLTPDFYVTYEKDVANGNSDKAKLEYRINRRISIESQIGDNRTTGVDILWRHDFGD